MKNLSKGTEVYAFDLDPMRRKAVVDMGGKVKSSLKEITSSSTYIFLSLFSITLNKFLKRLWQFVCT